MVQYHRTLQKNASYALTVNTPIFFSEKVTAQTACNQDGNCLVTQVSDNYEIYIDSTEYEKTQEY